MSTYTDLLHQCTENNVTLVAVSKTKPNEAIMSLYNQGQRIFGENRVQELRQKHEDLPSDIIWHMIGHLQTNKVKHIAPFVSMIHSGDRSSLLHEINKQAARNHRQIDVLLQIKIAKEATKEGWEFRELMTYLDSQPDLQSINIRGVMGMATFTDDKAVVSSEFARLKRHFDELKKTYFSDLPLFDTVSMGMSGDFTLAIAEGSNMIRIGSLLFGAR